MLYTSFPLILAIHLLIIQVATGVLVPAATFRCFVTCGGPERTVQGSRPYKWGQGVSCGYLIRR